MPKNRNRAVKSNFDFPPEFLNTLPDPEEINISGAKLNTYLPETFRFRGTTVKEVKFKKLYNSLCSSECDTNSCSPDFDINSFGKSSASSVSWSDEFDTEATQLVQKELEQMERVLQGKQPIPSHYNRDEYQQWINTFPQLSISGNKMRCPKDQSKEEITLSNNREELFAFHSDTYPTQVCDSNSTSKQISTITNIKNSVIDKVFKNVSTKLLVQQDKNITKNTIVTHNDCKHLISPNQQPKQNDLDTLSNEFNECLRISPASLQESPRRHHNGNIKQQQPHSIFRSDKLSSKWMQEESLEYSSLPHISTSAKNKSLKPIENKNLTLKSRNLVKPPGQSKNICLPPIKSLPTVKQYRSISATPHQAPSDFLSVTVSGIKKF